MHQSSGGLGHKIYPHVRPDGGSNIRGKVRQEKGGSDGWQSKGRSRNRTTQKRRENREGDPDKRTKADKSGGRQKNWRELGVRWTLLSPRTLSPHPEFKSSYYPASATSPSLWARRAHNIYRNVLRLGHQNFPPPKGHQGEKEQDKPGAAHEGNHDDIPDVEWLEVKDISEKSDGRDEPDVGESQSPT